MQARYYDPMIGRFYSNDPVGYRDVHSFNRYAYANNNSYKFIDPSGMTPSCWDSSAGLCAIGRGKTKEERQEENSNGSYSHAQKGPTGNSSPVPGTYLDENGQPVAVTVGPFGGTVSLDGTTAYDFDSETGMLINPLATGAAESVCPSCYLIGGGSVKFTWTAFNGWVAGTLSGPRVGHRLFTATRKNGTWNTGKYRFGWSGKNGSDTYQIIFRYKQHHIPTGIKTTRAHPSGG